MPALYQSIQFPGASYANRSEGPQLPKKKTSFFQQALQAIQSFGAASSEETTSLTGKPTPKPTVEPTTKSKNLTLVIEHTIENSNYLDAQGMSQFAKIYVTILKKVDEDGRVVHLVKQCINGTTNRPCDEVGTSL